MNYDSSEKYLATENSVLFVCLFVCFVFNLFLVGLSGLLATES